MPLPDLRKETVLASDTIGPSELMRRWSGAFCRGVEARLGFMAQVDWQPADQATADLTAKSLTWFEQAFGTPELVLAFGVSAELAESLVDRANGDAQQIITDVLDRAGEALATELQMKTLSPVPVQERAGVPEGAVLFVVSITIDEKTLPLLPVAVVQRDITGQIGRLAHATAPDAERMVSSATNPKREPEALRSGSAAGKTPSMSLMLDMQLPMRISLGKTTMALKDILKLTSGSMLELNRTIDDPVEIVVNNCVIAEGEVVVVEGNYGTRIQSIKDRSRFEASLPVGESSC